MTQVHLLTPQKKSFETPLCWHFSVILSSANMFCSPYTVILSFLVASAWFYCFLRVESAPQRDVHDLNEELRQRAFKPLCSVDDFKASLTCPLCGITLRYQDKAKAVWLVKRHTNENSHKIKAGWYLDADNHVVASKPKGKRQ